MENPRHWRLNEQRYRLIGEVCPECDTKIFPPRDVCPDCHGEVKVPYEFSGKGEVYSFATVVDSAPEGYEEFVPYTVALVKLEEGPMITAQLTDLDGEPSIGMRVEMVTRKLRTDGKSGMIVHGYKFRPPIEPAPTQPRRSAKK